MFSFSSSPALIHKPGNIRMQGERNPASCHYCGQKPASEHTLSALARIVVILISAQILLCVFFTQAAPTQEITDPEISNLKQQFDVTQQNLISIDARLVSLNEELTTTTNEISVLKEELRKSGGIFGRFRNVFRNRRLGKLSTRSQDMWNEISSLENEREALIKQFILLADDLIDKSSIYVSVLMVATREADLKNDIETRDKALKQVSTLWQQTEKTTTARNKYARVILDPKRTAELPPLVSSDPRELRLVALILKNAASESLGEAAKLEKEIKDLEQKKLILERMLDLSKDIKRSSEERGTGGIDFGTPDIPWGSERDIGDITQEISQISDRKKNFEAEAKRYKTQSEALEWQASQIEAELKGKPGDD